MKTNHYQNLVAFVNIKNIIEINKQMLCIYRFSVYTKSYSFLSRVFLPFFDWAYRRFPVLLPLPHWPTVLASDACRLFPASVRLLLHSVYVAFFCFIWCVCLVISCFCRACCIFFLFLDMFNLSMFLLFF